MVYASQLNPIRVLGKTLVEEFNKQYPVDMAFYIVEAESHRLSFYIASRLLTSNEQYTAYGKVCELTRKLIEQDPAYGDYFDPFTIRLIDSNDQLAQEIRTYAGQASNSAGVRLDGLRLGHIEVDQGYLFPGWIMNTSQ